MAMPTKLPTKDEMRARFWALTHAIAATEAKSQPKRQALSDLTATQAKLAAEARKIESDVGLDGLSLFDAKQEKAFLARGLGNVGTDPALAA